MAAPTAPPKASASPPSSVEVYDFSLSRSTNRFRFRLDGQEWYCDSLAGQWDVLGTDTKRGTLTVRCRLRLENGAASVYPPKDSEPPVAPEGQEITSHIRLCYNRAGECWRLRDERTGILHSNDIKDYRGRMNVNRFDNGPHIFHDGKAVMDAEGVAHFVP